LFCRLNRDKVYDLSSRFFNYAKNHSNENVRGEEVLGLGFNGTARVSSTVEYLIHTHNSIWQKSFYDHVIRDETGLDRIREYVVYNPLNWHLDSLNPKNMTARSNASRT
jgi:hypothetical protein